MDKFALPMPDRAGLRELGVAGPGTDQPRRRIGRPGGSEASIEKPGTTKRCGRQSSESKAAGLGVSVLTLVGAGGVERAESHVEQTVRLIESLELGAGRFCVFARRAGSRNAGSDGRAPDNAPETRLVGTAKKTQGKPGGLEATRNQGVALYGGKTMDVNSRSAQGRGFAAEGFDPSIDTPSPRTRTTASLQNALAPLAP